MAFGMSNCPATCQRLLYNILNGVQHLAMAHMDDICIFSATFSKHMEHLKNVLQQIKASGLKANRTRCKFAMRKCNFLATWSKMDIWSRKRRRYERYANIRSPEIRGTCALSLVWWASTENSVRISQPRLNLSRIWRRNLIPNGSNSRSKQMRRLIQSNGHWLTSRFWWLSISTNLLCYRRTQVNMESLVFFASTMRTDYYTQWCTLRENYFLRNRDTVRSNVNC